MPDENDVHEWRQTEEEEDHKEKELEQLSAANREAEEQKEARLMEKALRKRRKLDPSVKDITKEVGKLRVELHDLFCDRRMRLNENVSRTMQAIDNVLDMAWKTSAERKLREVLERRAERIKKALREAASTIDGMRTSREKVSKNMESRLQRLLGHDDHLKLNGAHDHHRLKCAQSADGCVSIAQHLSRTELQKMETNYIKAGTWHPRSASSGVKYTLKDASEWHSFGALLSENRDLRSDRIASIFKRMAMLHFDFNPIGGDAKPARASLNHPIRLLGHEIRAIEFECKRYRIFPETTFARTWATLNQSHYIFAWKMSIDELKSWTRIEKTSRYRSWYTNILREVQTFAYRVDDIILDYKHLINEGAVLLCPHRHREFHEWYCKTFTGFQTNRFGYLHLQSMVDALITELRANSSLGSRSINKARFELFNKLEDSVKPQVEWRREYRQWSEKLMATLSVGYLLDGRPKAPQNPGIAPWTAFRHINRSQKMRSLLTRWSPQAWLDPSLLPSLSTVPIDYVISTQTLYAVLDELRNSKILGIDIVRAPGPGNPSHKMEYILLANEAQIVVLDFKAIDSQHLIDAIQGLKYILENKQILKVGFQSHIDMMFLWRLDIINMESYYPLHARTLGLVCNGSIPDKINLASLRSLRDDNPQLYFYSLACRPYAALRAFHANTKQDNVQSLPHGNVFDLSSVKAQLDKDIQQGRADRSLGPVTVDLMTQHAFGRKAGPARPFITGSRGAWLKAMSLQMASRRLKDGHKSMQKLKLPEWEKMGADSQEQCQKALAAYYMAAVFGEDLRTIVNVLEIVPGTSVENFQGTSVARCAAWILWAAKVANLPINDGDKAMLQRHCHGMEIEDVFVPMGYN